MANSARITHAKTIRPTNGSDTGRAYGKDWNDDHVLTGLENVDNTSDADKPVSTATQAALNLKADGADLTAHVSDTANPHAVTATQIGLGNVNNTSDVNKPVSTAQAAADTAVANAASAALTSGLANKVVGPASVTDDLPAIFDGTTGKLIKSKTYSAFKTLLALVKGDVGLGNVDNTSDATKNAATATLTNKTIDTAGPNTIKINGNTLAATAGVATVTIPNATDTLVGRATTDTLSNKTISGANNTLTVREADLSTSDVTTANVSTTKHGFAPKLPNDATKYLDGTGAYTVPAGGGGSLTPEETVFWKDQAALLDPAAYVYWKGASWSVTVPAGETWYVVNAWVTTLNGSSTWFHRKLATKEAFEVHAGDVIAANGNAASFLYVCRPALVIGNSAYSDPKGLYFSRMSSLRSMQTYTASATITAGGAVGAVSYGVFPTDFDDGMAAHSSAMDVAWVIFNDNVQEGALNTIEEISDTHQWRTTTKLFTPFLRAQFPMMSISSASVDGNPAGTTTALNGQGVLSYYKLPSNWRTTPQRPYKAAVLADSPRIYYPCDEASGTTINDLGSAALNASLGATALVGSPGATGDGGTAIRFTDSSGRIIIPNSANFDFASSDFTLEIWVMFKTLPAPSSSYTNWIVNGWITSGAGATYQAFLLAVHNGKIGFLVGHTDATSTAVDTSVTVTTGVFYHVIAGRSGGNLFVRLVGKEARQTTAISKALRARSTEPVWIGTSNNGTSYQFNMDGRVEEFALYSSALSDARADAHHAAALGWA